MKYFNTITQITVGLEEDNPNLIVVSLKLVILVNGLSLRDIRVALIVATKNFMA